MKDVITIANYEAYYLDYLEGNLSDELVVAFELFLEEHPELAFDGELETLVPEQISMDAFEKEILKKDPDLNTIVGLEVGLIAEMEGVLEPADKLILETKKANNSNLQRESHLLALTALKADKSIEIAKDKLYQKEVSIFAFSTYYRVVGIAALLLIGFFLFNWNNQGKLKKNTIVAKQTIKPEAPLKNEPKDLKDLPENNYSENATYADNNTLHQTKQNKFYHTNSVNKNEQNGNNENQKDQTPLNHPAILPEMKDNKVIAIAPVVEDNGKSNASNQDLAFASTKKESVTPIQYLKNKVEDRLDGQIALTTNDRTKGEKKGFFLKLGSMEISHNRSKK